MADIDTEPAESWSFPKPDFMPPGEATGARVLKDSEGKHWLLFERAYSWAIRPSSARLTSSGATLEIAVRLGWVDDIDVPIPAGEVGIAMCHEIPGFDSSAYGAFSREAFGVPLADCPARARIV